MFISVGSRSEAGKCQKAPRDSKADETSFKNFQTVRVQCPKTCSAWQNWRDLLRTALDRIRRLDLSLRQWWGSKFCTFWADGSLVSEFCASAATLGNLPPLQRQAVNFPLAHSNCSLHGQWAMCQGINSTECDEVGKTMKNKYSTTEFL